MKKVRVLAKSEASYLNTGFGVYYKELLTRLYNSNKYELAELGAFAEYSDPRNQQVPWKFYPVKPNPQDKEATNKYNSDQSNNFGRWLWEQVCLDFCPDVALDITDPWMMQFMVDSPFRKYYKLIIMPTIDACFVKGTPVITDDSVFNIEDIYVGQNVVSHDGTINQVKEIHKNKYSGELITIHTSGPSLPITATASHPIFAIKYQGNRWTHTSRLPKSTNHKYHNGQFISASKLSAGDYLVIPKIKRNFLKQEKINISEWVNKDNFDEDNDSISGKGNNGVRFKKEILLDEDFGRFLGLFVSEGCANGNIVSISMCHSKEQEYLNFVTKFIKDRLNPRTIRRTKHKTDDAEEVVFYGKVFSEFMIKCCGENSHTRKIPKFILEANDNIKIAFLEYLFIGDGCDTNSPHKKRVISYTSVSKTLALQVSEMLLDLNILSSISRSYNNYTVNVMNFYCDKLADLFKWPEGKYSSGKLKNSKSWIDKDSGHALIRIKKIEKTYVEDINVYNLTVENTQSYCTIFAVHNCPLQSQWLNTYSQADIVLSYTDWGGDLLKKQFPNVNHIGSAPPAAEYNLFHIPENKPQQKQSLGFDPNTILIGWTARNQKRKLFPDLFKAFHLYLQTAPQNLSKQTYLHIHTCWPDIGWDIPLLLKELDLQNKIVFTYHCHNCGSVFPSFFSYATTDCIKCKNFSARMPSSHNGISREWLAHLMKCWDVSIQYASAEGFGMPSLEASACGVVPFSVDYSAMSDVVRKCEGFPIKVKHLNREVETHRFMAVPDNDNLVKQLISFLSKPSEIRAAKSMEVAEACRRHYNWDRTAQRWMDAIDSFAYPDQSQTWASPVKQFRPNLNIPDGLSNSDFVQWCIVNIAGMPELLHTYTESAINRDVLWGQRISNLGGPGFDEMSALGLMPRIQEFKRDHVVKMMLDLRENTNAWEARRIQVMQGRK